MLCCFWYYGKVVVTLFGIVFVANYLKRKFSIGTVIAQRWFGNMLKEFPTFHHNKTLPMKLKLFETLSDLKPSNSKCLRILEIGAESSGANLQFYPENTQLTVVDPNPELKTELLQNLQNNSHVRFNKFVACKPENIDEILDDSFDAVVSTLALCTCDKVDQVYKEICRVLVPGGKYYFMEHVIDDQPLSLLKIKQVLASHLGIFPYFLGGCRPDKDLEKDLSLAGFKTVKTKRFRLDLSGGVPVYLVYLVEPHLYGTATAP